MKPCIHLSFAPDWREQLRDAAGAGFSHVAWSFQTDTFRKIPGDDVARMLSLAMGEHRMRCVQTHLPYYDLFTDVCEQDEDTERAIRETLRITGMLGAEAAVMHPRSATGHNFSRRLAREGLMRDLESYLPIAEQYRTSIALENLAVFPDRPELLFFGAQYEDLLEAVDRVASPHFGICWDTGHANLMHLKQGDALRELGNRLFATHIHSNSAFHDDHTLPTSGTVDFTDVIGALYAIGYEGPLCLEVQRVSEEIRLSYYRHGGDCLTWLLSLGQREEGAE